MRSALTPLICGFLVASWASTGTAKNDEMRERRLSGAEITRYYSGAKVNVLSTEDYALVSDGEPPCPGIRHGQRLVGGLTDFIILGVHDTPPA